MMIDSDREARREMGIGKKMSVWCNDWVGKLRVARLQE